MIVPDSIQPTGNHNLLSKKPRRKESFPARFFIVWALQRIQQHREELQDAAQQDKDMEYRVHPPLL